MFYRLKKAVRNVEAISPTEGVKSQLPLKYPYNRPKFLRLTEDDIQMAGDHRIRPIIHPSNSLPYFSGYAECCNGGKTKLNEDMAACVRYSPKQETEAGKIVETETTWKKFPISYSYFALFDGHAGVGASLSASHDLHHILNQKLVDALDDLLGYEGKEKKISNDLLIMGALEAAFVEMDKSIEMDKFKFRGYGGCTALVAIFIFGKLYVANAGDSRAVICSGNQWIQMSMDFTPENERDRIRKLASEQPELLGSAYTSVEYSRQARHGSLGSPILYREAFMKGWAYKLVQQEDLKIPVVVGTGKRSRLMGTIGVSRGFGDHDLVAVHHRVTKIKPFLSCHPEIRIFNLNKAVEGQVLIMGTDGFWDVITEKTAGEIVSNSIQFFKERDRYISAATCLVGAARGSLINDSNWQLKDGKLSSPDDISVFVIPLLPFKTEYEEYLRSHQAQTNDAAL